jgi:hypothetical protein
MSKEYQEPEEKEMNENAEIIDEFSPFDEPVIEKPYTRHNVRVDAKDFTNPIPEPSFTPPPMMGSTLSQEDKVKKEPPPPINREMNEMSKKDKHDAAGKVAEMIMSGYKWANGFADSKLLFDQRKIAKLQKEGEIDLSVDVPISPSQSISAGEFLQEYNEQTKGTIKVSKEFEEEVTPVLTRVLEKKGIGFTDEQLLMYLFGKDLVVKGFLIKQSLNVKKEMLETLKEATMLLRGGSTPPTPPQFQQPQQSEPTPPPPPSTPPPPTYQQPFRNTDTNVNDFVNEMTGGFSFDEMQTPTNEISDIEVIEDELPKIKTKRRGRPKK